MEDNIMLSKKKKIFILCGMLALLIVTGVLNIVLNGNAISANSGNNNIDKDNASSASFFDTYRSDRTATREQTMIYLDAIINNSDSDSEAVEQAKQSKVELTKNMEIELVLEGLIKALGFDDVVVTNSTESVNVIVKAAEITEDQATQISDVILTETGRTAFDVRIITVE